MSTTGIIPLVGWHYIWFDKDTAMKGALNVTTPWGIFCVRGTAKWYLYLSPNGTPWASTFAAGPGVNREAKARAKVRRALWGHGYDCSANDPQILDHALDAVAGRDSHSVGEFERIVEERPFGWGQ